MSIRQRIYIASLTPLAFAVVVLGLMAYDFWKSYSASKTVEEVAKLTKAALELVHEFQKERGMSAGYIGSSGAKFGEKLRNQRKLTDEKIRLFKEVVSQDSFTERAHGILRTVLADIEKVKEIRRRVDALDIDKIEVVKFYTKINNDLISLIGTVVHLAHNIDIGIKIIALREFSSAKDLEGIKRALLSVVFAQDRFDEELLVKYTEIDSQEKAFLKSFFDLAPEEFKKIYLEMKKAPSFVEAERLEKLALEKRSGYGVDPEHWFDVQTKKINGLKGLEDYMLQNITQAAIAHEKEMLSKFAFTVGISTLLLLLTGFFVYKALKTVSGRIDWVVQWVKDTAENMEFEKAKALREDQADDEFRVLEKAIVTMFTSFGEVVNAIASIMRELAQGHFNRRVEGSYKGDIKVLVDNINLSLENLQRAVNSIKEVMSQVARGDLKTRIENVYKGDLSELVDYINSSLNDLQNLLIGIRDDIAEVTSNIASITTSVDETSEAIRQISEETFRARSISSDMEEAIEKGKTKVELMDSTMANIVKVSKDISSITETIVTIAEQTNLLALNAAIEAARAGEMGRGFAVVADEVRRLAEISGNAAKEIASLVEKTLGTVEEGKSASEEVVQSFSNIEKVSKEIVSVIDAIATAMEEQSRAVDIIRENVTEILKSTERIEENMKKFNL